MVHLVYLRLEMALNLEKILPYLLDRQSKWNSEDLEWLSLYHQTLQEVPWGYEVSELAQGEEAKQVSRNACSLLSLHSAVQVSARETWHSVV